MIRSNNIWILTMSSSTISLYNVVQQSHWSKQKFPDFTVFYWFFSMHGGSFEIISIIPAKFEAMKLKCVIYLNINEQSMLSKKYLPKCTIISIENKFPG